MAAITMAPRMSSGAKKRIARKSRSQIKGFKNAFPSCQMKKSEPKKIDLRFTVTRRRVETLRPVRFKKS